MHHAGYFCTGIGKLVECLIKAGAHELNRFNPEVLNGGFCIFLVATSHKSSN